MANSLLETIGTLVPDTLFAGNDITVITQGVMLAPNEGTLARGTVLGLNGTDGTCKPVDSTANDGTETPYAVLTDNVDTTGDDPVRATAYFSGHFNSNALVFGGTDTVATHWAAMRTNSMFASPTIPFPADEPDDTQGGV